MMFIKKIFEKNFDDETHLEFLKFGRGEFKNKYLIEAKKQKDKWTIKTSSEFANFFVKKCLEETSEKVFIKGIVASTIDIEKEIKFPIENIKKFMGIKQILINFEISPHEILELIKKYPRAFFALSFKTQNSELKIKAKAPKSAKASTSGKKGPKASFCVLKTKNQEIIKELFFDAPNFNEIKIRHILKINEIIYPNNEKDPRLMRENSKRKGLLLREIEIDNKRYTKEAEFIV